MASSYDRNLGLAFVGGFLAALLLGLIIALIVLKSSDVYGLSHWKLNVRMPLSTMWMNLGYWTDSKGERIDVFEEACATLLNEVLRDAGILKLQPHKDGEKVSRSLAVLDLGFGCGDQTWELVRLTQPGSRWRDFRYVGLTLNEAQTGAAWRNIRYRHEQQRILELSTGESSSPGLEAFHLFRADAARPETWTPAVKEALASLNTSSFTDRWLLALDCLYHFRPSRQPIMRYAAARELRANLMAFDLLLNPAASPTEKLVARVIGVLMGCPWRTFLTEHEYRAQLVECGYDSDATTMRDVSEHVFASLVDYMERQGKALSDYGIGLGGFKVAGRLFDWFARSGVIRAVIVVGRLPEGSD